MIADRTGARLMCVALADNFIRAVRAVRTSADLAALMEAVSRDMGFRYYALIHHDDLRRPRPGRVDLKDYPAAIVDRLIDRKHMRRDPVVRACNFAEAAFVWSDLPRIIHLDRHDKASLEIGAAEGLNEGITVPCVLLGDCIGSCTFAGIRDARRAARFLGPAQMIGIFAFQAARRICAGERLPVDAPHLHPRPRDCVMLAGRGMSNKQIARALSLTPRTVDGYLTEARETFGAHGRTELVIGAVLAGEVGLDELAHRQPE